MAADDLRAAIRYTLSPDFPPPNDDSARIAFLRAWWQGEEMRMGVFREHLKAMLDRANHIADAGKMVPAASEQIAENANCSGLRDECCHKTVQAHCEDCPYVPVERCACFRCIRALSRPVSEREDGP